MPQKILVRRAQPEDAFQMHHVHVTSVRTLCASDYTSEQIEAWVGKLDPQKRRQYMTQGSHSEILFVAEGKLGMIVGFSSLGINEVNAVHVHPHYTQMGIGTLLLNAVETEALAQNMKKLKLSASITAGLYPSIKHEATRLLSAHFILYALVSRFPAFLWKNL